MTSDISCIKFDKVEVVVYKKKNKSACGGRYQFGHEILPAMY